jgi:hypothetical protein
MSTNIKCQCLTERGTQCTRLAKFGDLCTQHAKMGTCKSKVTKQFVQTHQSKLTPVRSSQRIQLPDYLKKVSVLAGAQHQRVGEHSLAKPAMNRSVLQNIAGLLKYANTIPITLCYQGLDTFSCVIKETKHRTKILWSGQITSSTKCKTIEVPLLDITVELYKQLPQDPSRLGIIGTLKLTEQNLRESNRITIDRLGNISQ